MNKDGFKPQQARDVLPNATKTEVIHTAFIDDCVKFKVLFLYVSMLT